MARIREVVEKIQELEERRKEAGDHLATCRDEVIDAETAKEDNVVTSVTPEALAGKTAAGVDGGLLKKAYQGVDIVMTRAVGAIFSYGDRGIEGTQYLPGKHPDIDIQDLNHPLDRHDFQLSSSILRVQKELSIVDAVIDEEPDIVLLDGSIVPQYTDRPAEGTHSRVFYDDLMDRYRTILAKAREKDVLFAGVIEDSRSSTFGELVAEQSFIDEEHADVVRTTRDTALLFHVLERGDRTCVTTYTDEYEKHPTLKDVGEHGREIYNFYLRTAERDVPVRIDFLNNGDVSETADSISSLILPLCDYSKDYGIPSVIVEADQRAKLSQEDIDRLEARFDAFNISMPGMRQLRRNNRPF